MDMVLRDGHGIDRWTWTWLMDMVLRDGHGLDRWTWSWGMRELWVHLAGKIVKFLKEFQIKLSQSKLWSTSKPMREREIFLSQSYDLQFSIATQSCSCKVSSGQAVVEHATLLEFLQDNFLVLDDDGELRWPNNGPKLFFWRKKKILINIFVTSEIHLEEFCMLY